MAEQTPLQDQNQFKRRTAYKFRIGSLLSAQQIIEAERLKHLLIDNKEVVRINLIANIIDKYIQEGEKQFGSLTLDDATGQIKAKVFGEDISKFSDLQQGDTVLIVGLARSWNSEIYLTPEIIKKKDPSYLLIRKLECELEKPKSLANPELAQLKDKLLSSIKEAEKDNGIEIEKLIIDLKEHPDVINAEIKKLLEEGLVYEPRPGKLRYLG
jgi:uncharacterized protein